MSVPNFIKIG